MHSLAGLRAVNGVISSIARYLFGPFTVRHASKAVGQEHLHSGYSNFVVEDEEQVARMTK
jgi:hypothetical protein